MQVIKLASSTEFATKIRKVSNFCTEVIHFKLEALPDPNPIEHIWNILEKKLVEKKPKNLEEKIKEEWLKIPTIKIQNLISSMPSRVAAVITAKGSHTKY